MELGAICLTHNSKQIRFPVLSAAWYRHGHQSVFFLVYNPGEYVENRAHLNSSKEDAALHNYPKTQCF
jgi:hypothetical protein